MTTTTIIKRKDGQTIERTGTSGLTVTATRDGNYVNVLIEFDNADYGESKAMIASLLSHLDENYGENFVAQCFNHYAMDMNKKRTRVGGRDLVVIRGHKDKPISKRRK